MNISEILRLHALWSDNDESGERANLWDANLRGANLQGVNLRGANLWGANLWDADLWDADLRGANLWDADLRDADLRGTDLRGADFRDADLRDANLQGANLWGAVGNLQHLKSLQLETYPVTYTSEVIQIGCQQHAIEEWRNFNDEEIIKMDGRTALMWWRKWKDWLFATIEMSPAEPTEYRGDDQ